jgi:chemotaxis protein MotB
MKRLLLATAIALGIAGCGVSEDLYNARVAELNKVKADLEAERKATADDRAKAQQSQSDLEKQIMQLKSALGAGAEKAALTEAELANAKKRAEELAKAQEAAEARAAQFKQLFAKFQAMIDKGKLKVEIRNGLMLVKLADNILFDPGKTALKSEGKEAIKEVSGILAGIQGRKFQVAGHTDNQPLGHGSKYKTNWELSTARAVEVVHFMIDQGGMPKERLSAAGFADQLPISANDTEDGRKANRRIEIVLLPNIEDLPPMDEVSKEQK